MVPRNGRSSNILSISRNARANSSSQSMALFPTVILAHSSPPPLSLSILVPLTCTGNGYVVAAPFAPPGVLDSPGSPAKPGPICIGKSRGPSLTLLHIASYRAACNACGPLTTSACYHRPAGKKPRGTIADAETMRNKYWAIEPGWKASNAEVVPMGVTHEARHSRFSGTIVQIPAARFAHGR